MSIKMLSCIIMLTMLIQGSKSFHVLSKNPMIGGCPYKSFQKKQNEVSSNPNSKLDLSVLNQPNYHQYNYREEVQKLDYEALKADVVKVMKDSKSWWPADYGNYGPFFVRLAWHNAGTYRIFDGRGGAGTGQQRFTPQNGWRDNANLDKARRLLWPVKKKYGKMISWADLFMTAGNHAMEDMGLKTLGVGLGRVDASVPESDTYWGTAESYENIVDDISSLEKPLADSEIELIYVDPEGPGQKPDPMGAAAHIRETFGRMAMNDMETVALIAGGHSFGKAHGAAPGSNNGPDPRSAKVEEMGLGWVNSFGKGNAEDTITSGLEGAWTNNPIKWDNGYFSNLFKYEWEHYKSPAGANQWRPTNGEGKNDTPDAHIPGKFNQPMMFTTDVAQITDPEYLKISKQFYEDQELFTQEYAKAWYKLIHRDMGPVERLLGSDHETTPFIWQDPVPKSSYEKPSDKVIAEIKQDILSSNIGYSALVRVSWASASTFRQTDYRGGANGARISLKPQNEWPENNPEELEGVLSRLTKIGENKGVSKADMIIIAGNVAIENSIPNAPKNFEVPLKTGREDALQSQTDIDSFDVLRPRQDAFRNMSDSNPYMLVDKAAQLGQNVREMVVLIGGLRVLGNNVKESGNMGVLTKSPGHLTNDYFVNLQDMSNEWIHVKDNIYQAVDRETREERWTASLVDLTLGSNHELRDIVEMYATDDAQEMFVNDFVAAWAKVMNADSYGRF